MKKTDIPEGYSVHSIYGGKWAWESILSPESHSASGFSSYEEALNDCRKCNGMEPVQA